jgi:AraC-like DNA-binding protein
MRSAGPPPEVAGLWDIATPSRPMRLPGVRMAGFRSRAATPVDLQMVPYPAVTLFVDLRDEIAVQTGGVHGHGRDIECLQVRLAPTIAHAVLGAPGLLGGGTVLALEDLWGRDARRMHEHLRDAASWAERFAIAEDVLAHRLAAGHGVDPEVAVAWQRLVTSRGRLRVERLAGEVGWSRKRLWARCRAQVGLTPKRAAQLVRFDRAVHRLAAGQRIAQVALEGGYVDQSHLHRDVLAFAGLTPAAVAVAPWLAVDDVAWPAHGNRTRR